MTSLAVEKKFGYSLPPYSPHTITAHLPGWKNAVSFRDGDKSMLPRLKSMYPRFTPWGHCRELAMKLCKTLSLPEGHFVFPFLEPGVFCFAQAHAFSEHRKEHRLSPEELDYRVVDVGEGSNAVRLYLLVFPLTKADGVGLIWGNAGVGISTRLAEALLPAVDDGKVVPVPWDALDDSKQHVAIWSAPKPTGVPEGEAHAKLRERIVGLWKRAAVTPEKADMVRADDVQLFPTGMAAIYRMHLALMQWRSGAVVPLGSIFHNTWHLYEEAPQGYKHFGRVDGAGKGLDEFEAYLEAEAEEGRKITYAFVEFPSNPILVSPDLKRLRELADKFDFLLVVDDTIGSFCNVDLSAVADIVMTSTTKSFSGYADVMGGSLVFNPASRLYASFKPVLEKFFLNEYFIGDAEKLLSNSADYLERSTILNRNALTLATWLDELKAKEPEYGITKVLYPTTSDTLDNYKLWMRKPTEEFTPGYGCLFSIEFGKKEDARIFYDNLEVFIGPHLGAHQTLAICFNELVLGKDPEVAKYHGAYGATLEQIRIAVGLEGEDELKKVFEVALEKVKEAKTSYSEK
ncbi:cystathionine gamma-synthase [Coniochaeta ligniaria NRRL 30616]|uniref:Cystathionine gamma-synthase n=1 Tax=Coniochaeta ligniaria NRRL 30616 TaxID=1408157 RepID=A0A1J7K311_9PEZI|nr:cystathionine gamma-synthase [Coniochaeta ligniaria NRRL 30616]